jgi:DNA-binding IclR family transcriptional regulator
MLAFLPDAERQTLLDGALKAMTVRTVTNRATLRRQIEEVRRKGYAVETGENEDGSMCIGVPIMDESGHPLAAMSLSAPERRMTRDVTAQAIAALQRAANRISVQLGAAAIEEAPPRQRKVRTRP